MQRGDKPFRKCNSMRKAVDSKIGKFTKADVMKLVPSIGKASVENMLKHLLKEGYIERYGKGRATFYVRK